MRKPLSISTSYSGATDTRGSRIIARGMGRQATIPYDYALRTLDLHDKAARTLAERLGVALAQDPCDGTSTGWRWIVTG